jgi:hypothetical protein
MSSVDAGLILYTRLDCPNLGVSGSRETDGCDTGKQSTAAYMNSLYVAYV